MYSSGKKNFYNHSVKPFRHITSRVVDITRDGYLPVRARDRGKILFVFPSSQEGSLRSTETLTRMLHTNIGIRVRSLCIFSPSDRSLSGLSYWRKQLQVLIDEIRLADVVHFWTGDDFAFSPITGFVAVISRFFGKKTILGYDGSPDTLSGKVLLKMKLCYFYLYDQVVVSSQYCRDVLKGFGIDSKLITLPVELAVVEQRQQIDSVVPRIMTVIFRECRSEITCALKAFKLVKQKYPRAEMVFLVSKNQLGEVNEIIDDAGLYGITATVESDEHVSSSLKWADVFLNGSNKSYAQGIMLKAMATGVPVISIDDIAVKGIVGDNSNKLLWFTNHVDLSDRFVELVEDPGLANQLSQSGKDIANRFLWSQVKKEWQQLYRLL